MGDNNNGSSQEVGYSSAQVGSIQDGKISANVPISQFSGRVPAKHLGFFMKMKEAFDEVDKNMEDTSKFDNIFQSAVDKQAHVALEHGSVSILQNIATLREKSDNAKSFVVLRKLREHINEESYVSYTYGKTGTGKSYFNALLLELWLDIDSSNKVVITNVKSIQEWGQELTNTVDEYSNRKFIFCENYTKLVDVLDEEDGDKIFLFDEASSHASGYSDDSEQARMFGKMLNLFRKTKTSLLIIGHTGKDVHPDIRRKASALIIKDSKKTARIFEVVQQVEGNYDVELFMRMSNIPQTTVDVDTYEASDWTWNEFDDETMEIIKMDKLGLTQSQIAEVKDTTQPTIHRKLKKAKEENRYGDVEVED